MPECFEKCLIRICYCIALLRIPDFKDGNEDKIFDILKTKPLCLEHLKKDILKLEEYMKAEK
jgi:hypothetical protein